MDEGAVRRSMTRITHEIIEKNSGANDIILLGIHRRGMPLAAMLKDNIRSFEGTDVPLGSIDISLYRDDLTQLSDLPETGNTVIPCDITGKKIIVYAPTFRNDAESDVYFWNYSTAIKACEKYTSKTL